MTTEPQRYLAYMLRLWLVSDDGEPIWRASLESPHTGERLGFGSLEELFDSLRAQVVLQPKTGGKQHEARKESLGNHTDLQAEPVSSQGVPEAERSGNSGQAIGYSPGIENGMEAY